jgi:hypothetical protein
MNRHFFITDIELLGGKIKFQQRNLFRRLDFFDLILFFNLPINNACGRNGGRLGGS